MGKTKRSRRSQTSLENLALIRSSWPLIDPRMCEYPTRERRDFNLKIYIIPLSKSHLDR